MSASLALLLLVALTGSPSPAGADSTTAEPAAEELAHDDPFGTIHVELQTRMLSTKLTRKLAKQFDAVIEARVTAIGLALEPTPAADVIVQLEISRPQADAPLHVVQCIAAIDGDVVVRGEVQSCMGCTAAELIDRGLELLPDVAEAVLKAQREAERAAAQARAALEAKPPPPAPDVEPRSARALGPVGYAGISVSALGLGSTIAGAVLLARGDSAINTTGPTITFINYRPPGWALVGAGLAATVAGNVLLGVDLGLLRRRRERPSARISGVGLNIVGAPGVRVQGQF